MLRGLLPDLPDRYSAGDTFEEVYSNAKESTELWLEVVFEDRGSAPEVLRREHPEWTDWTCSTVEMNVPDVPCRGV